MLSRHLRRLTAGLLSFAMLAPSVPVAQAQAIPPLPAARGMAANFTAGNVVIYRVGTGAAGLVNTGAAVFLDEYTPAGALVQSVALPTTVSGSNRQLVASGTATSEGLLTRSADGRFLVATGYGSDIPAAGSLSGTTGAAVPRVVGLVDSCGSIDTTTALSDFSSGNNPRSAASTNGTELWVAGGAAGIRYATLGGATSTQLSTTVTNLRQAGVVDGQLMVSTGSGSAVRLGTVGTGTPATTGQTITNLPGIPLTGSPYSYFFADLDAGVAGNDTLYLADDGAAAITKYSLVAGTWTSNGVVGADADDYRGITGAVSGTTVTLFATRKGGSGSTGGGELVSLTDASGYNAAFAGTPTVLATAAINTAFRGIAAAPTGACAGPVAPTITDEPDSTTIATGATATLNLVATGTEPLTYQWYQGNSGDTSTPVGTNSPSFTTPALLATTSYWCRVSNGTGFDDSVTAIVTVNIVVGTPPTISAVPVLNGVIADPTNPGVAFTVNDLETLPADLAVTATGTTNPVVAPLANVTITPGAGGDRTVTVAPAGVGYADITITVTDANTQTATGILKYAASAASDTPATSRYHHGGADASTAMAVDANYMFVADDEGQALRLYSRQNSGMPVASFDFTASLGLTDISGGDPREVDIESSARVGNRIYWMGSHSNSSGGASRPNRQRIFATDLTGSGAGATLSYVGRYDGLRADLIAWDSGNAHGLGAGYYGLAASATIGVIPEAPDGSGFNIEGLEFAPGSTTTAYIGFRAPIAPAGARTKALVVPVTNFSSLVSGNPTAGPATFGAPIELDLGGRGVRELRKNSSDDYIIVAGPASSTGTFAFYTWNGNPAEAPVLRNGAIPNSGGSIESIVEVPETVPVATSLPSSLQFQVVTDNGDTVFYNDGQIAKDLPEDRFKKARSDIATLGIAVGTTRIRDIQGAAHLSPLAGQAVAGVPGVVTAKRTNGFYLQDTTSDANPATSEGIFVFTSGAPTVAVGDSVTVSGTVTEFRAGGASSVNLTLTEITSPTVTVLSSGNPLPAATVIGAGGRVPPTTVIDDDATGSVETSGTFDAATDGIDFWESLEGMLVQVNNAVASGPRSDFGSNREIPVLVDGGAGAGLRTPRGGIIIQPTDFNPERIILNDLIVGGPTLPQANVGDSFPGAVLGVIDYNFSNFKLEVTSLPSLASGGLTREVTSVTGATDRVTVATFNVENLDPNDPPSKFNELAAIVVNNLKSPDILALEEIQDNNGATNDTVVDSSLTFTTFVNAITTAGGPTYSFRVIDPVDDQDGGEPGGNIRVGFLYNAARVTFTDRPGGTSTSSTTVVNGVGGPELSFSPGRLDPTNAAFNSSRKPLAGEFTFNGQRLFLVANHFNSKGGDQPLFGRFQPPVLTSEAQRLQQANIVASFVSSILTLDANAKVVVLGDINDFEFSNPMNVLKAAGLTPLIETLPANERYSYVFQGNAQTLDHILVSNGLLSGALQYDVVHVNAEFGDQISDHDPQVAAFTLTPPVVGGKNLRVSAGPITLNWDAGNAQTAYYLVRADLGTGLPFTLLGPLAPSATSYTDTTALPAHLYCYVVAPVNGGSLLGTSDMVCGMNGIAPGPTPALQPGAFSLALNQSNAATLTWTAPSSPVDSYILGIVPMSGAPVVNVPLTTGTLSYSYDTAGDDVCFVLAGVAGGTWGQTDGVCGVPGVSSLAAQAGLTVAQVTATLQPRLAGVRAPQELFGRR